MIRVDDSTGQKGLRTNVTVFKSYEDDGMVILKDCMQLPELRLLSDRFPSPADLEPRSAR